MSELRYEREITTSRYRAVYTEEGKTNREELLRGHHQKCSEELGGTTNAKDGARKQLTKTNFREEKQKGKETNSVNEPTLVTGRKVYGEEPNSKMLGTRAHLSATDFGTGADKITRVVSESA